MIKKPGWQKKKKVKDPFWEAKGSHRVFLDKLFEYSLAPMRLPQSAGCGVPGEAEVGRLLEPISRPKCISQVGRRLSSAAGFLQDSGKYGHIRPADGSKGAGQGANHDGSISFRELSEGEQQLLLVLGLLRFTKEDEALFLLDEPDTHLNPQWSVQYLQFIESIVGKQPSSHILMATHDPLVFSGLMKSEVRIMQRDATDKKDRGPSAG